PFFSHRIGDALVYHGWAMQIAAGEWVGTEVFYQAPLYPYLLALIYALGFDDIIVVRLAQIVLGATSCVLLALAGRGWFSERVGVLAGVLLAVYAPAVFFDALLQKSVLDLFLICLLLWLLSRAVRETTPAQLAAAGVACGLLTLTRENALVLAGPIAVWIALPARGSLRHRATLLAAYGLGIALLLAPVAARNAWVGGEFVVTTSQLGPNLYIGNHAGARGVYHPLSKGRGSARFEREDATRLAERDAGRRLSPSDVSRYWLGRAASFIRAQPADWAALMVHKFVLLVNATEVPDTEDQYVFEQWSAPLRWAGPLSHFGVWIPLALFGVWASSSRWREIALLYLLPVTYAASVVAFYIMARYRLPLVPFLLLFGAVGLCEAPRIWRSTGRTKLAMVMAVIAIVAIVCNQRIPHNVPRLALAHYNLGSRLQMLGQLEEASSHLRIALQHARLSQAHENLGAVLQAQGRPKDAVAQYLLALELDASAPTHALVATALRDSGEELRAIYHYRQSIALDPSREDIHYELAVMLRDAGDLEAAGREFGEALKARRTRQQALSDE
ncbi:MAG: glycosyltransferase family 39 protein, partial [Myxococcota bacterium]